ncbi:MAG: sigma-54-dependent transcriptional regulator [Acidobacteriota bacterium]
MSNKANRGSILVLDDEKRQQEILALILRDSGFEVNTTGSPAQALQMLETGAYDVVLTDLKMPAMDGIEFLLSARRILPDQLIIVVTAHGSVPSAVDAMKKGAFHYLTKPLNREELILLVERAVTQARLIHENRLFKSQLDERCSLESIVGRDGRMQEVFRLIRKVAPNSTTVMIYGESGTGKELVARAVHQLSPRAARPMFSLNCAAIPEALLESELFGYEKGAFTGAFSRKKGLLEEASGSSLFLDEVGDLGLPLQGKLLRVLQEREVQRLGSSERIKVDVRIISATHRDIAKMIAEQKFREDLYYRLNTFPIVIPPLRERTTDIPILVEHFLKKYKLVASQEVKRVSPRAMQRLLAYSWPGNVRQLESAIERAMILAEGNQIEEADLPPEVRAPSTPRTSFDWIELPDEGVDFEELEKHLLVQAMEKSGGVMTKAARLLGMTYRTLNYRLEKYGLATPRQSENVSEPKR